MPPIDKHVGYQGFAGCVHNRGRNGEFLLVARQAISGTAFDIYAQQYQLNEMPVLTDQSLAHVMTTSDTDNGVPVSYLLSGASDADSSVSLGVAITGIDESLGAIQYSTDGGSTWQDIGGVGYSEAFLLAGSSNNRIRLNPNSPFAGSVADGITFQAWDESIGQSGQTIDLGSLSNANAVSANIDTLAFSSLQVSTLTDENDGNYTPGHLSLREALAIAYQSSGNLTITFAPGLTGQILLNSPLTIGNSTNSQEANVSIQGPGAGQLTINANGSALVFSFANNEIAGYDFSLSGVKLTGATGAAISESVEGCLNLTLNDVVISGNSGAAIDWSTWTNSLSITNSTIANNTTTNAAAISILNVSGYEVHLTGDTISGNQTGSAAAIWFSFQWDFI